MDRLTAIGLVTGIIASVLASIDVLLRAVKSTYLHFKKNQNTRMRALHAKKSGMRRPIKKETLARPIDTCDLCPPFLICSSHDPFKKMLLS
jgi:hypothetical protein